MRYIYQSPLIAIVPIKSDDYNKPVVDVFLNGRPGDT